MLENYLKISFVLLSTVFLGLLFGSSPVSAQSQEFIEDRLILKYPDTCNMEDRDITTNWVGVLFTPDFPDGFYNRATPERQVILDNIRTALNDGHLDFILSTSDTYSNGMQHVRFDYSTTNYYKAFIDDSGGYSAYYNLTKTNTPPHQGSITFYLNQCQENIGGFSTGNIYGLPLINSDNTPAGVKIFISTFEYDYDRATYPYNDPDNPPVPDSVTPENNDKIGVSIRGSVVEDIVSVEWYHDPDNPPPENAQGIYLVLHNTNFDPIPPECSNDDIQEWRHSLDEIAIFNPVPCYGFWYVQSYYTSDPQGQNIIPNTDKTTLNLRIDGGSFYFDYTQIEYDDDGTILSPPITGFNMSDCVVFIETVPWVEFNYQGCFDNIQKFIGIASTNNIHVSKQFENVSLPAHYQCGSMTKINNWIYVSGDNNYLCPQVPEPIRQAITLFAVFLLYLVAMFGWFKFMNRGSY